jgi:succinate dehydrogenase/fumarate reductase-like Fe-S protein
LLCEFGGEQREDGLVAADISCEDHVACSMRLSGKVYPLRSACETGGGESDSYLIHIKVQPLDVARMIVDVLQDQSAWLHWLGWNV